MAPTPRLSWWGGPHFGGGGHLSHRLGAAAPGAQGAIHIAETKAGVTQVDQFYWDRQRQSYLCVAGTTKDQTRVYVLIRQKTGKVTLLRQAAGISASTARKQAVAAFAPKKVLSVGLSRRGKNVVWDVGYESKSGKLGYVTYDFKTGDQLKAIANL
ncbi:cell wall elongation regulator TseB-like domain-containing protein [Lacticaseibacillus nasuensis]|uniref:cell wall elongation regulator TseB-like domain-containing protein n=1 Tax=Lacticaseibacillus nasuensis TaxID=944671 RepID=UPI0006D0B2D2|nr:DUF5590 domain-containing protein [Lacticaseibacillus nasuensis]